ncbi:MAG: KamA family radical SAM protein [Elusimicrobiota bacterium]
MKRLQLNSTPSQAQNARGDVSEILAYRKKVMALPQWSRWQWHYKNRITTLAGLRKWLVLSPEEEDAVNLVSNRMCVTLTPFIVSNMSVLSSGCPLRKQFIATPDELKLSKNELSDPCGEVRDTVLPRLVKRYPSRVLLLATNTCAAYCRYCTRRRIIGKTSPVFVISTREIDNVVRYLKQNKDICDVLISGGDPLILSDTKITELLYKLRAVKSIGVIRMGTRVPVTLPQRVNQQLCRILKNFGPVYVNIHFNHVSELSEETMNACETMADNGIILGSQTVLLKDINDTTEALSSLFLALTRIRVRPYYLYQCDLAEGTEHFRVPVRDGIKLMKTLRGYLPGYAVPTYVIDAPGGGGKVPVGQDYVVEHTKTTVVLKNYKGKTYFYPEPL